MTVLTMGLALLCGVALQEAGDPRAWAKDLGSDDPQKRDEATRRLRALEDAAIPALTEAARSPDQETAVRAKEILAYLNRTRRARKLLAPGPLLTLEIPEDRPQKVSELLKRVGNHFGVKVAPGRAASSRTWSGRLKEVTLLEAVDRLSAAAGLSYSVTPGEIRFRAGRHVAFPADYVGSFKVMIRSVSLRSTNEFFRSSSTLSLTLAAVHQTGLIDVKPSSIRVEQVEFDTGDTVKIPQAPDIRGPAYDGYGNPLIHVRKAPAGAKVLRSIRGTLVVTAPASFRKWTFRRFEAGEKTREKDGLATLLTIDRGTYNKMEYLTVFISIEGETLGSKTLQGVGEVGSVRLISKTGEPAPAPPSWPPRHVWSAHARTVEVEARFLLPPGADFEPGSLVLRIARDYETVEEPFEIRDVSIR